MPVLEIWRFNSGWVLEQLQLAEHVCSCNSILSLWACEKDQNCMAEEMLSRTVTFARQFLDKDSELTVSKGFLSAAKTLVDA